LNRFEKAILRILLKNGNEMDKERLVRSFPDEKIMQAHDALLRLVQLGFVTLKYAGEKCIVVLPRIVEEEALRIVDPDFIFHKANTPKSELIPRDYVSEPFLVFYGEKEIHGTTSEYWLCRKKKDRDFIGCFIFNADGTRSSITLGRLPDPESLVSKFLNEIDRLFPDRAFFKKELAHNLPRALVGNRQPIKAITEYLCLEGFLERTEAASKFRRTEKRHIMDSLDAVVPKETKREKSVDVISANGKPVYYIDEDFGVYPNFYY